MTDHYTYHVTFSLEDNEYVATTQEFGPGVAYLDPDPERALAGVRKLAIDIAQDMKASGEAEVGSPHD